MPRFTRISHKQTISKGKKLCGIGFYYTEKLYRLSGKSERKCDFLLSFITLLFDILSHECTEHISCFVFDVIYLSAPVLWFIDIIR